MTRFLSAASLFVFFTVAAHSQSPTARNNAHQAIQSLQNTSAELARSATRDAEILNLLRESARALDGTQKHNAIAASLEKIGKADQLAASSIPKVKRATKMAHEIVGPVAESPMTADLQALRLELQRRPIAEMRQVVADEIFELATLATRLSDISLTLTKALAAASSASVGRTAD